MEDVQPNEVRLSRKGSTVPVVKNTYYGRARGRGRSVPFRGTGMRRGTMNTSRLMYSGQLTSNSQRREGVLPQRPLASAIPASSRYPQQSSDDSHSYKRRNVDASLLHSSERREVLAQQGCSAERYSRQENITLELPPEWRKGVPGSPRARNRSIQTQKHSFWTEKDMSVIHSKYIDQEQSILFMRHKNRDSNRTPHQTEDADANGEPSMPEVVSSSSAISKPSATVTKIPNMTTGPDNMRQGNESSGYDGAFRASGSNDQPTSRMAVASSNKSSMALHCQARSSNEGNGSQTTASHEEGLNRRARLFVTRVRDPHRILPPKKEIIDLTLDTANSDKLRWTTFRSGTVEVPLLSLRNTSSGCLPVSPPSRSMTYVPLRRTEGGEEPKGPPDTTHLGIICSQRGSHSERHGDDRDLDVPISALLYQDETAATGASNSGNRPMIPVDPASAAPMLSGGTSVPWDLSPVGKKLGLPLKPYDKPRRILRGYTSAHVVVTMHGFIDRLLGTSSLRGYWNLRYPSLPSQEFVDDACVLGAQGAYAIIIAHAREKHQLTLLASHDGHELRPCPLDRPWNLAKRGGVSALTTLMQPLQFVSGGYDHKVHLWHTKDDFSSASSTELAIKHTSVVQSLLPTLDTSHKLISAGADCNVHLWDMSSERVAHSFKTSSIPYNVHRTDFPFCTLLEVAHRDLQFEIRDHRVVPEIPTLRFGFYTDDMHGRYMKGDTWSHYFISGSRDGGLRLWDLRNVSSPSVTYQCFDDQVIQVIRTGEHDILACSKKNEFALINLHGR